MYNWMLCATYKKKRESENVSCSVLSDSLGPNHWGEVGLRLGSSLRMTYLMLVITGTQGGLAEPQILSFTGLISVKPPNTFMRLTPIIVSEIWNWESEDWVTHSSHRACARLSWDSNSECLLWDSLSCHFMRKGSRMWHHCRGPFCFWGP